MSLTPGSSAVTFFVPTASVLEIVKDHSGRVGFNRGTVLAGRTVERKVAGVIIIATKEASVDPTFDTFFGKVKDVLERRAELKRLGVPDTTPNVPDVSDVRVAREISCNYCKEPGHVINICPKVRCNVCNFRGHTNVCPTPKCATCERFGHSAAECRKVKCEECGRDGHVAETCFTKIKCEDCGRTGHPKEKCRGNKPVRAVWCAYHAIEGDHPSSECPDLKKWECENCGEKGHFYKTCRNQHIIRQSRAPQEEKIDTREYILASGNSQPVRARRGKR